MLFFAISYNKTRALNGGAGKPIARFPDAVSFYLLACYILLLSPVEAAVLAAHVSTNPDADGRLEAAAHRFPMFPGDFGVPPGAARMRRAFERSMHDNGVRLRTSQYPQLHVGLVKTYSMRRAADHAEAAAAMASVIHGQAGHSAETAHHPYGVGQIHIRVV
jgi:hypothetical protein